VRRHNEIADAGGREVVVFHSTDEELRRYAGDLPFAVVADPTNALYDEFGVGTSPRSVLHPRALASAIRGGRGNVNLHPTGGHLGLPADFLVGTDGRIVACKRGRHADDQWTADEVLAHAHSENA
jgi:hypothetical protein